MRDGDEGRDEALWTLTPDAVVELAWDGRVLALNPAARAALGAPVDDAALLLEPGLTRLREEGLPRARAEGHWRARLTLRGVDGAAIPASVTLVARPSSSPSRPEGLTMVAREEREQDALERRLRAAAERLQLVLDYVPQHVFWKDRDSVYLGCNREFARVAGVASTADIVGKTDFDLAWKDEEARFFREVDERVMSQDAPEFHIIEPQRQSDGREAWLDTSKIPLHDARGEVVGILGMYEDITERRNAEERLRQSQKMESIGRLAGGVAHDFNNMLTAIGGAAELLTRATDRDPVDSELVDTILQAVDQASDLTQKLLDFSHKGAYRKEPLDLHHTVRSALRLLERAIDRRIEVKTSFDASHAVLDGDSSQLQNVILNLGLNARDAMPTGGRLVVCTRDAEGEDGERLIELEVTDTGVGMPPEVARRAFEPFFTTKDVGRGTGLGLAAVYGAIQEHGGSVSLESSPGVGTRVTMRLPVDPRIPAPPEPAGDDEALPTGRARLLLADDEPPVAAVAAGMLRSLGYEVVVVNDGEAAVAELRKAPGGFDLVLLDMVMPRMSGREALLAMRKVRPEVRVLFCSGFHRGGAAILQAPQVRGFLKKPYRLEDLARAVAAALAD